MKKALKIISLIAILLFGVVYIASKIFHIELLGNSDIKEILVIIYVFSTLYYYRLELKVKNAEIQKLKYQLSIKDTHLDQEKE